MPPPCVRRKSIEVGFKSPLDAGTKNFDGNRLASSVKFDLGAVHLCNRGGSDRRPEGRIDRRKRLAESPDDHRLRLTLRERRHLVLQTFQVVRDRRADDIRPGGEELPEFDVSGPKLGQCRGKPTRAVFGGRALDQSRQCDHGLGRQRQRPCIDKCKYAFARKHKAGAGETYEMRGGSDHNRQPE